MKKMLLILAAFMIAPLAQAQVLPSPTASPVPVRQLSDVMKDIKAAVGLIGKNVTDPGQAAALADKTAEFRGLVIEAMGFVPESITKKNLPPVQTRTETLDYVKELSKIIPLSVDLEQALLAGDLGKASTALQSIADVQKSGHKQFK